MSPIAAAMPMDEGPRQLYLQAVINGNRISGPQPFTWRMGSLWASPEVLRRIGFKNPGNGGNLVRLNALPGTRAAYDIANQAVAITAPLSELDLTRTVLEAKQQSAPALSDSSGLLLNYDLYGTYNNPAHTATFSAATELRAFSPLGVLSNTMLSGFGPDTSAAYNTGYGSDDHISNVRLDTAWTSSWPDKEISLTLGDTVTTYLPWTRATRIGGIRLGRNFALQPWKTTSPLPAFMGSATLPSAVDLYIDGIKRYNGTVPAGPFELNGLPTVNGLGNAQVVLTDALGQSTMIDIPFYSNSNLLAQGLSDWSIEAGYVRGDYGLSSFSYASKPVFSGTLRYGLNNRVTVETHAENTQDLTAAGVGLVATLGLFGQLSGSYTGSRNGGQRGTQYSLGYQWENSDFHFAVHTVRADSNYRDAASLYGGSAPALRSESAVAGMNLNRAGTINFSYVETRYPDSSSNRYAGAYWGKSLGDWGSLNISYNRNLNTPSDQTVFVGLTVYFGNNLSIGGLAQHSNGQTGYGMSANKTTPAHTGWGWAVQGWEGPNNHYGYAQVDYRGLHGEYRAGVNASDSSDSAYAGASGSVVLMNGSAFAGRKIYDGFAVVSTNQVPNVPVSLQNNLIGRTDDNGMLMISPLMSYQENLVSINTMQLPPDIRADRVDAQVATRAGSGALVKFDLHQVRAATVILHGRDGGPLPLGASVRLNGLAPSALVGYDGITYLEGLKKHNSITAAYPAGECSVAFNYRHSAAAATPIGPLLCE